MANYNAPWNKGLAGSDRVKLSKETRLKMSLSHTGTTKTLEVRQKISKTQIGISKPNSGVRGENHYRWNPNKSAFKEYRRQVQCLTEKNYRLYKATINPHDFPRTKCGVLGGYQIDHKISVKEGFDKGIPSYEIGCVSNLQMLPWKENRTKGV